MTTDRAVHSKPMMTVAINCIDGRVQLPVLRFLKRRYRSPFVDVVTEPGPSRVLADQRDAAAVESIVRRVRASIRYHEARLIAVVAHHDCAASPLDQAGHQPLLEASVDWVSRQFPETETVGLWVDERWRVSMVVESDENGRG